MADSKADIQGRGNLVAVLLADSFTQMFRPITLETPKVLLPLANIPMIEYSLAWLKDQGVKEVYVFCCAHASKVKEYIRNSKWAHSTVPNVHTLVATNCQSVGDAMRAIYSHDVIKHDFILISADTVCNFDISIALQEHRERRAKDSNAIMTMVVKPGVSVKERVWRGETELMVWWEPSTRRIWRYQGRNPHRLPSHQCIGADDMMVSCDLLDTNVAICTPAVLSLFSDNFDYRNLRADFVPGVLAEEELGNKIHLYLLPHGQIAYRAHSLRSYAAITDDIQKGFMLPYAPMSNVLSSRAGPTRYRNLQPPLPYEARPSLAGGLAVPVASLLAEGDPFSAFKQSGSVHTPRLKGFVIIAANCFIEPKVVIHNSVVGRACAIRQAAMVVGSVLMDGVEVGAGAYVEGSVLCEGAVVGAGAVVRGSVVLGPRVVVAPGHRVPEFAKISLQLPVEEDENDSDNDTEHPGGGTDDDDTGTTSDDSPPSTWGMGAPAPKPKPPPPPPPPPRPPAARHWDTDAVGPGGKGYLSPCDPSRIGHDSFVAPADNATRPWWGWISAATVEEEVRARLQGEADSEGEEEGGGVGEGGLVPVGEARFRREVAECFLRCVALRRQQARFNEEDLKTELRTTKSLENGTFLDIARYLLTTMLALALPPHPTVRSEYRHLFASAPPEPTTAGMKALFAAAKEQLRMWSSLLRSFVHDEDSEVDLLVTLEEWVLQEGSFEGEGGPAYADVFVNVVKELYDTEVVSGDGVLAWAALKEEDDAEARVLYNKCKKLVEWLQEDDDEDEEDEDEDEE